MHLVFVNEMKSTILFYLWNCRRSIFCRASLKRTFSDFSSQIVFFTFYRQSLETDYVWDLMIYIFCLERIYLRLLIKHFLFIGPCLGIAQKKCLLITWEKNVLNKTYVSWGSKHSLFLCFFCKSVKHKENDLHTNIGFLGSCRKSIFYNFTEKTKFMIVFHLQSLAAERHRQHFLNFWKIKFKIFFFYIFFQNYTFLCRFFNVLYFFLLETDLKQKSYSFGCLG